MPDQPEVSADIQKLMETLKIKPEDIANLDPNLQQLRRADLLVKIPLSDPLTAVIEGEAYDIAKIAILKEIFTLRLPAKFSDGPLRGTPRPGAKPGEDLVVYGGLPATMAGIARLIDILPAIDGKRAGQFVDAIKPAQPNIPVEMPREEGESMFEKIRGFIFGRSKAEQNRYQGER
jgi:hypothetical protein